MFERGPVRSVVGLLARGDSESSRAGHEIYVVSAIGLVLLGVLSIVLFGLIGIGRGDTLRLHDLQALYAGGVKLAQGINPYGDPTTLPEVAAEGVRGWIYAYPPSFMPLIVALSRLGYTAAAVITVAGNVVLSALIAWMIAVMAGAPVAGRASPVPPPLQFAVAGGLLLAPFVAHVVWLGNPSLLVTAALIACWRCADLRCPVLAGLLLALAAIKPQMAILAWLWMLLERRWTTVATAALATVALSGYAMVVFGPIGAFRDWLGGIGFYLTSFENESGCLHCFGVADLLAQWQIEVYLIELLALVGVVLVWRERAVLTRLEVLALLCCLTALFLPVHNYDLVLLAPVIGVVAVLVAGRPWALLLGLAGLLAFYVPLRLVDALALPLAVRWREVMLVAVCVLVVRAARRRASAATPA